MNGMRECREGGATPLGRRSVESRGARGYLPARLRISASRRLVFRDVAQLGSAPEWGSGGRGFKSRRPDWRIGLTANTAVGLLRGCLKNASKCRKIALPFRVTKPHSRSGPAFHKCESVGRIGKWLRQKRLEYRRRTRKSGV